MTENEVLRAEIASIRKGIDHVRSEAETAKIEAETARLEAETAAVKAETARVAAEGIREHGSSNFRKYRQRAYLAFILLAIAATVGLFWNYSDSRATKKQAKTACLRSQEFGPELAAFFEAFHRHGPVIEHLRRQNALNGFQGFGDDLLRFYRETIPKEC
jgi:hypothetical protein